MALARNSKPDKSGWTLCSEFATSRSQCTPVRSGPVVESLSIADRAERSVSAVLRSFQGRSCEGMIETGLSAAGLEWSAFILSSMSGAAIWNNNCYRSHQT